MISRSIVGLLFVLLGIYSWRFFMTSPPREPPRAYRLPIFLAWRLTAAHPQSRVLVGIPIDINSADAATLETLRGVGPALARRILAYRSQHGPFPRVEALQAVPGIGPHLMQHLVPWITAFR